MEIEHKVSLTSSGRDLLSQRTALVALGVELDDALHRF